MPLYLSVLLRDSPDERLVQAAAIGSDARLVAFAEAPLKADALSELELRLCAVLQRPFQLHVRDICSPCPSIRVLMEEIAVCGVWVATAFTENQEIVGRGECCCAAGALDNCLRDFGEHHGDKCMLTVEWMGQGDEE